MEPPDCAGGLPIEDDQAVDAVRRSIRRLASVLCWLRFEWLGAAQNGCSEDQADPRI